MVNRGGITVAYRSDPVAQDDSGIRQHARALYQDANLRWPGSTPEPQALRGRDNRLGVGTLMITIMLSAISGATGAAVIWLLDWLRDRKTRTPKASQIDVQLDLRIAVDRHDKDRTFPFKLADADSKDLRRIILDYVKAACRSLDVGQRAEGMGGPRRMQRGPGDTG